MDLKVPIVVSHCICHFVVTVVAFVLVVIVVTVVTVVAVVMFVIREFKMRRLQTTNYGWTSVVLCL